MINSGASVTYTPTSPPGTAGKVAGHADVAIVFASASATEGQDRESLSLSPDQVSRSYTCYLSHREATKAYQLLLYSFTYYAFRKR